MMLMLTTSRDGGTGRAPNHDASIKMLDCRWRKASTRNPGMDDRYGCYYGSAAADVHCGWRGEKVAVDNFLVTVWTGGEPVRRNFTATCY